MIETRSTVVICVRINCFGCLQGAQLVSGPHRRHVEVERQQSAIFVALVVRGLRCNLLARQSFVDFHVFVAALRWRQRLRNFGQILVLAKLDRLRHIVFCQRKIFRRQARGWDYPACPSPRQLRRPIAPSPTRCSCPARQRSLFCPICCALSRPGERECEKHRNQFTHRQNLTRIVACRLRIGLADCGNPNCALSTVVIQLLKTA